METLVAEPSVTVAPDSLYETRTVEAEGGSTSFKFLVIDSPDKWQEAESISLDFEMTSPGRRAKTRFPMRGISMGAWEAVEERYWTPQYDDDELDDKIIQEQKSRTLLLKRAAIFEKALGGSMGSDDNAKIAYLQSRNAGEIDAIFNFIQYELCAMRNGEILSDYESRSERATQGAVEEFKGFDDWKVASESRYSFLLCRPGQDFIIEFPLKAIDRASKEAIEEATKDPEVAMKPAIDKATKRVIPGKLIPDYNDAGWRRRLKAVNQKRTVMYLEACLMFEIPGSTQMDRYEWLSKRLVGDVIRLRDFIVDEMLSYKGRYDFFTRGLDLRS